MKVIKSDFTVRHFNFTSVYYPSTGFAAIATERSAGMVFFSGCVAESVFGECVVFVAHCHIPIGNAAGVCGKRFRVSVRKKEVKICGVFVGAMSYVAARVLVFVSA